MSKSNLGIELHNEEVDMCKILFYIKIRPMVQFIWGKKDLFLKIVSIFTFMSKQFAGIL